MANRERDEGLIYYALDATRRQQFLKIGYSSNLRQRIADLRLSTSSGQPPTVLALEAGGVSEEQQRHEQFADLRQHGEWFRFEGALVEFVAGMEHPFSYLLDRPNLWCFAGGWGPLRNGGGAPRQRQPEPAKWKPAEQPRYTFPLRPGHSINADGIEVGPDGLPPIDF